MIGSDNRKFHKQTRPKKYSKKPREKNFLTPKAKLAFSWLREVFIKVLILYYFIPKHHIHIEIEAFGYAIDRTFS